MDLTPSLAYTALLEQYPGFRALPMKQGSEITARLVADWHQHTGGGTLWDFATAWVAVNKDDAHWWEEYAAASATHDAADAALATVVLHNGGQ